jgi:hypothetical protein
MTFFAGEAAALHAFQDAIYKENRFHPAAFLNRKNSFAKKNVSAILLEVPNRHVLEVQVSSWVLPPMLPSIRKASRHDTASQSVMERSRPTPVSIVPFRAKAATSLCQSELLRLPKSPCRRDRPEKTIPKRIDNFRRSSQALLKLI